MSNVIFATPKLSDGATIAEVGSEAFDMPATNLQNQQPSSPWRATSLGRSYIELDFGSATTIDLVALLFTNASSQTTVQIRGASTQSGLTSSPAFNTGDLSHWPTTGLDDWDRTHFIHTISSTQSHRWWRLDVKDPGGHPDGYYQAGRLYMDKAFQPARSIRFGWGLAWKDGQEWRRARGGQIFPRVRQPNRVMNADIRWETEADAYGELFQLQRLRATGKDILVIPDPADSARLQDFTVMGLFSRLRPLVEAGPGIYETSMQIEETI